MPHSPVFALADLRSQIARLERGGPERLDRPVLPFGDPRIDTALPGRGLARSALHELVGVGPDTEHAAIPALMVAAIAGRLSGPVLWAYPRLPPFAPALAAVGLGPERVIYVQADQAVLGVIEDALRAGCRRGRWGGPWPLEPDRFASAAACGGRGRGDGPVAASQP